MADLRALSLHLGRDMLGLGSHQNEGRVSLKVILSALALLGRYGTQGFAASILVGLALPQLASAARPLLPISIFMFVAMTFARADLTALKAALLRPKAVIIAVVWLTLAPMVAVTGIFAIFPRDALDPGMVLGLAIMAASPPLMSGPALAMMLNIEPTVLIAGTIITTVAAPFVGPPIAELLLAGPAPLDTRVLMLRLLGLIGGAIVFAALVRRVFGHHRLITHKLSLDGFGVVMYFLFAMAAMDGVADAFMNRPGKVFLFLAVAFGMVIVSLGVSMLVLRRFLKPSDCFLLGYATGQRNMGAMIAALGAATPETTFLFFALAQFPIYLMPQLIKPLARRFANPVAVFGKVPAAPTDRADASRQRGSPPQV